jgi:hypothetical protein
MGKMTVPVAKQVLIYSHFEHVSGVAAPDGTRGVAISKLKILDTLIGRLAELKSKPAEEMAAMSLSQQEMSDAQIDAMIPQYEKQIDLAKSATVQAVPMAGMSPASGSVVSIAA